MKKLTALFEGVALALLIGTVGSTSALARDLQVQQLEPEIAPASVALGDLVDATPSMWFVELSSPPAVEGTKLRTLKNEKAAFRSAARKAGLEFTERYAFDKLWNGLSIKIDPASLSKLARINGVKALYPVVTVSIPETVAATPDMGTAVAMTGADIAQSDLGYTGKGIKVAVMDTGIDYDHPDLGGCFGDGCRVAYGYDLVGDDFNADDTDPAFNPIPVPDEDPDDCGGHGTHVAGIVGANGDVVGVAPEVTLGAYRVFGCEGSTFADIMIEAMEMALADGMDVLNMSIGSTYQWPQYPTAQASDRLVNKGMVVVASIGNSGSTGTYSAGAPGVGKKVIGVASFDNTHSFQPYFEVAGTKIAYNPMSFALPAPTSGTEEMVFVGRGCTIDLPYLADPAGKVALIERGACSFNEKATNALAAGATAAVIHNSGPGNFNGTLGTPVAIAAVSISGEDGQFIRSLADPVNITWTDQLDSFPSPTGGLISSFSSYGLAPDLSLKPDIGAPGGSIYSTYVMEKSDYATLGGTSMASPHTAGAAALLLQAHPKTNSQKMRRILQNSADPAPWSLNPGLGFYDNVHRQGAGMLDIDDAITATTIIEPGKISLGEGEAGPTVHTLTIENKGSEDVTYDLTEEWYTVNTTGTFASDLGFWLSDGFLMMPPSVHVPAGGEASFDVVFVPPTRDLMTHGGYILFTPQGGGQEYRVPYAGIAGDYQDVDVLDANPFGLPFLLTPGPFTMENGDMPEFWVNFGHQSRKFRMEVFDANTGKAWHRMLEIDYMGRNSAENIIFSFVFDGTTTNGKKVNVVPDGDYVVVISVLKALGDSENPDHWETWTSPAFTIDRP
jgi:subtilisin family serine protease